MKLRNVLQALESLVERMKSENKRLCSEAELDYDEIRKEVLGSADSNSETNGLSKTDVKDVVVDVLKEMGVGNPAPVDGGAAAAAGAAPAAVDPAAAGGAMPADPTAGGAMPVDAGAMPPTAGGAMPADGGAMPPADAGAAPADGGGEVPPEEEGQPVPANESTKTQESTKLNAKPISAPQITPNGVSHLGKRFTLSKLQSGDKLVAGGKTLYTCAKETFLKKNAKSITSFADHKVVAESFDKFIESQHPEVKSVTESYKGL